ncbi:MAG TPA: hypothetical protein VHY08_18010 [Bacillota bacterium]|nr:hypothetical protein [Bacillota bacterium]
MRLFHQFSYRISKDETTGRLVERAQKIATHFGKPMCRFHMCDMRSGVSAIQSIEQKYPELMKFEYYKQDKLDPNLNTLALSNLPDLWDESNPNGMIDNVDPQIIETIAKGVPRSYPLMYSTFVFDQIDWFKNGSFPEATFAKTRPHAIIPYNYLSSAIIIHSGWSLSRRDIRQWAVVEIEPPGAAENKIPELHPEILQQLHRLGIIGSELFIAAPTPAERKRLESATEKAYGLIAQIELDYDSFLSQVSLPHPLNPSKTVSGALDPVSAKNTIINVFKPRKFHYLSHISGRGIYVIAKQTKGNHQIKLEFDFAPMARLLSCRFVYHGPLWSHGFDLKFTKQQKSTQIPITSPGVLNQIIENTGAIVDHLETTLAPQLDIIYGEAPKWFEYQR